MGIHCKVYILNKIMMINQEKGMGGGERVKVKGRVLSRRVGTEGNICC